MKLCLLQQQVVYDDDLFHYQKKGYVKRTAFLISEYMKRFDEEAYHEKELEFLEHLLIIFTQVLKKPWATLFEERKEGKEYSEDELLYEASSERYSIKLYKSNPKKKPGYQRGRSPRFILEASFPGQIEERVESLDEKLNKLPKNSTLLKHSELATLTAVDHNEILRTANYLHSYDINWVFS